MKIWACIVVLLAHVAFVIARQQDPSANLYRVMSEDYGSELDRVRPDTDNIDNAVQTNNAIKKDSNRFWKLTKKTHIIQPSDEHPVTSGSDIDTVIFAEYDQLPENMTIAMYRDVPFEDNLIAYKEFDKSELQPASNSLDNYWVVPFDFSIALVTNDRYYMALTTQKWYGQDTLAVSEHFRVYRVGAQPNVPENLRYIKKIIEPSQSSTEPQYDCGNIPLQVQLTPGIKVDNDLEFSLIDLGVKNAGKKDDDYKQILEIDDDTADDAQKEASGLIDASFSIPRNKKLVGPFLLQITAQKIGRDKALYRSNPFSCY